MDYQKFHQMVAWPKTSGRCWPGWHGWRARCWHSEMRSVHSLRHHPAPSPFLSEAVCSWFCTSKKYLSTWCVFQGFLLRSQEVTWVVSTNGIKACSGKQCINYSSLRSTMKCPWFSWWTPSSQFNSLLLPPNSLLGCSFRQNHCSLSDSVSIKTTHAHSRPVFPFVRHPSCCRVPNSVASVLCSEQQAVDFLLLQWAAPILRVLLGWWFLVFASFMLKECTRITNISRPNSFSTIILESWCSTSVRVF